MGATGTASGSFSFVVNGDVLGSQHLNMGLSRSIRQSLDYITKIYRTTNLMRLEYDESYCIGFPEFDGRRQAIMGTYNAFNSELKARGGASCSNETIATLIRLVGEYFSFEESLMNEIEYAEQLTHKAEHFRFLESLHEEIENIRNGRADLHDFSYLIGSWLACHMRGPDKALSCFIFRAMRDRVAAAREDAARSDD